MIKRSNPSERFAESCGWWDRNNRWMGEWTYEGGRKREQVAADGERTRYQGEAVWLYSEKSG